MRQRALEIFNQKIEEERFIHENQVPIRSLRQLSDIFFAVFPCSPFVFFQATNTATKLYLDMVPIVCGIIKEKDEASALSLIISS